MYMQRQDQEQRSQSPQLQASLKSHLQQSNLQQSSGGESLNRSVQMKVTHERMAKLEQMYEQLSQLEAHAKK